MIAIIFFYLVGALASTGLSIYKLNENRYHMDAIGFDNTDKRIILATNFALSWVKLLFELMFSFGTMSEDEIIDNLWETKNTLEDIRSKFKK